MPGSTVELEPMNMEQVIDDSEHLIDSEELADLIRAAVANENTICFNAPGRSMAPFIQSGDRIFISLVSKASIRAGDVLAFVHPNTGRVLAHRVVRITGGQFFTKGDNVRGEGDGWICFTDVLGRVIRLQRNGSELRLGLGPEKLLIAQLSRGKILVSLINFLQRIKWGMKRLFLGWD